MVMVVQTEEVAVAAAVDGVKLVDSIVVFVVIEQLVMVEYHKVNFYQSINYQMVEQSEIIKKKMVFFQI